MLLGWLRSRLRQSLDNEQQKEKRTFTATAYAEQKPVRSGACCLPAEDILFDKFAPAAHAWSRSQDLPIKISPRWFGDLPARTGHSSSTVLRRCLSPNRHPEGFRAAPEHRKKQSVMENAVEQKLAFRHSLCIQDHRFLGDLRVSSPSLVLYLVNRAVK